MDCSGFFKWFRERRGFTQRELAELLDRPQSYIGLIEINGYRKLPMDLVRKMYASLYTKKEKEEFMDALYKEITKYVTDGEENGL